METNIQNSSKSLSNKNSIVLGQTESSKVLKSTLGLILILFTLVITASYALYLTDLFWGDANGYISNIQVHNVFLWIRPFWAISLIFYGFYFKIDWLRNIILTCISIFVTFWVFETICGKINKLNYQNSVKTEGPIFELSNNNYLGYIPKPNTWHTNTKYVNGKELYSIKYFVDKNGHRAHSSMHAETKSKYSLFFGCSMTFGEGVNSNETIPAIFEKYNKETQSYNFAYSGYGPSQMLAKLQNENLNQVVKQKEGSAFYIYIPDHVNRVISSKTYFAYNKGNTPYYTLNNDAILETKGLVKDQRKITNYLYDQLQTSQILNLFAVGFPFWHTDNHYDLTVQVINEAYKKYQQQFENDNFYVIIYPGSTKNEQIISRLSKIGIKTIDYSKLFEGKIGQFSIPNDGHPTALANEILAKQLTKDLN